MDLAINKYLFQGIIPNEDQWRRASSMVRIQPSFLIIGEGKCGTTSLYQYLVQHPQILSAWEKELEFFDRFYRRGIHWYLSKFPTLLQKRFQEVHSGKKMISGEASPNYLAHPFAPERVYQFDPSMKLIILVRNPVDRAYSAYRQQVRRGREHLSFSQAISREKERIRGTIKKMKRNRYKLFYRRRYFSYLDRGKYMKYIRKWQQWFPDTQLLVIKAERLFERTNEVFQEVLDFLQLDRSELVNVQSFNAYDYPPLDLDVREKLRSYFRPYNRELKRQFGISFQEQ